MESQHINIVHDTEQHYFKANLDNYCAYLAYANVVVGEIDIYEIVVPTELKGQGVAAKLAKVALDFADQQQLEIIPTCLYMERYMEELGRLKK